MLWISIFEFVFGITLLVFANKIYQISWWAKKELSNEEIKMLIISIRVLGVIFIFLGSIILIELLS